MLAVTAPTKASFPPPKTFFSMVSDAEKKKSEKLGTIPSPVSKDSARYHCIFACNMGHMFSILFQAGFR